MKLTVNNIRVHTSIGIYNWEKVIKRLVIISLDISSDAVIDYDFIISNINDFCTSKHFDYIEDLVREIKNHLFLLLKNAKLEPHEIIVKLEKPSIILNNPSASTWT